MLNSSHIQESEGLLGSTRYRWVFCMSRNLIHYVISNSLVLLI